MLLYSVSRVWSICNNIVYREYTMWPFQVDMLLFSVSRQCGPSVTCIQCKDNVALLSLTYYCVRLVKNVTLLQCFRLKKRPYQPKIMGYRGKATIVLASNTKIPLTSKNATSPNRKLLDIGQLASGHFKTCFYPYCYF